MMVTCALNECDVAFKERSTYDGRPWGRCRRYCSLRCARRHESEVRKRDIQTELLEFPRTCKACEVGFTARTRGQVYCTKQCRNRWRKTRENANLRSARALRYEWGFVTCGVCGVEFDNRIPYVEGKKPTVPRRFCALRCRKRSEVEKDRIRRLAAYGLTLRDYEDLLASQGRVCAICKRPEGRRSTQNGKVMPLHVDHDHVTGEIRGLLCSRCNTAIGLLRDDVDVVSSAVDYLKRAGIKKTT